MCIRDRYVGVEVVKFDTSKEDDMVLQEDMVMVQMAVAIHSVLICCY